METVKKCYYCKKSVGVDAIGHEMVVNVAGAVRHPECSHQPQNPVENINDPYDAIAHDNWEKDHATSPPTQTVTGVIVGNEYMVNIGHYNGDGLFIPMDCVGVADKGVLHALFVTKTKDNWISVPVESDAYRPMATASAPTTESKIVVELNDAVVIWREKTQGMVWESLLSPDAAKACRTLEDVVRRMVNLPAKIVWETGTVVANQELENLVLFKKNTHILLDEAGAPKFENEKCRVSHRIRWLAGRAKREPYKKLPSHIFKEAMDRCTSSMDFDMLEDAVTAAVNADRASDITPASPETPGYSPEHKCDRCEKTFHGAYCYHCNPSLTDEIKVSETEIKNGQASIVDRAEFVDRHGPQQDEPDDGWTYFDAVDPKTFSYRVKGDVVQYRHADWQQAAASLQELQRDTVNGIFVVRSQSKPLPATQPAIPKNLSDCIDIALSQDQMQNVTIGALVEILKAIKFDMERRVGVR